MTRKVLTGPAIVMSWSSLGGALEGVLHHLGGAGATPWVMGISGLAFRLALVESAAGWADGNPELAQDWAALPGRLAGLGRRFEIMISPPGARDMAKRREEAIKQIRRRIDRGVPVIAYDLHLPLFGIIKGYDDKAAIWLAATAVSSQYGETLPWSRWPVPERAGPLIVILPGAAQRIDPVQEVRAALRDAVSYAEHGESGDTTGAVHGLAAYERWVGVFAEGEPLTPVGNAGLIQALQAARHTAARFLRDDVARILPDAAPAILRAADAYTAEVLALSRLATMFPYPAGGDPTSQGARLIAMNGLRAALAHERTAIAALRELG